MASRSLMSAIVELRPDMAAFRKATVQGVTEAVEKAEGKLGAGMKEAGEKAGRKAGKEIGEGVEEGVAKGSKAAGKEMEKEIGASAERAAKSAADRTAKMSSLGNKLTLGVTAPVVLGFKKASDAFAEYEDQLGALEINYGQQNQAVKDWVDSMSSSYFISKDQALRLANGLAPLIQNFASVDEQAKIATESIARAGDMASMFGGSAEEAAAAITSFLSGSSVEPIRKYGVFASETAVKLKAMELGIVETTVSSTELATAQARLRAAQESVNEAMKKHGQGSSEYQTALARQGEAEAAVEEAMQGKVGEMTEGQKIAARHAIYMEQTSRAQNNAADTADSLANRQKKAATEMRNASIEAGERLAPAMGELYESVGRVLDGFSRLPSGVQTGLIALLGIAAAVGPLLKVVAALRSIAAANALVTISSRIAAGSQAAVGAGGLLGKVGTTAAGGALASAGSAALAGFAGLTAGAHGGVALYENNDTYKGFIDTIAESSVGKNVVAPIGGFISKIVPGLAEGGTVTRPGTVMVGEEGIELLNLPRGAEVRPLDKVAAAGDTYVFNVTVNGRAGDDPAALARELDKLSRRQNAISGRTRRPAR